MCSCPKLVENCKVGPEDWLVQNFELSKDFGFANYQIHQTAVFMPHQPTKVTRMISTKGLLLIERLLIPIKAINDPRPTHEPRRIDLTVQRKSAKITESEQEKVTVAIVNIANHRPRYISEKLLHFQNSMNSHLTAERNFEQLKRSRTLVKGILALKRKLPSEKGSIKHSSQSLERARFRDTFPSLNVIQTGSKNGRSPDAPPYDQRCAEWNEEQEEFAWQRAHKLHQELFKKGHCKDVHKTKLLQKLRPLQRRRIPRHVYRDIPNKGCA